MKKARSLIIATAIATSALPALVFAASKGAHHEPSVADLTYPAINFLIYLVVVVIAFKKLVPKGLQARAEAIRKGVTVGLSALQSAQKELAGARTVLTTFPEQAEVLRSQIARETENEAALIKSQSEARAKAIVTQARNTAAAEQRATEAALRSELSELIVKLAEDKIRRELTPESDRALRERAVQGVSVLRG